MRSLWKQCLALALGSLAASASAQEVGWRATSVNPAPAAIGRPIASSSSAPAAPPAASIATLGKPIAIASSRPSDAPATQPSNGPVIRGSAPDAAPNGSVVNGAHPGLHTWQRPGDVTPVTFKPMPGGHSASALPPPTPAPTPGHGPGLAANAHAIPYPAPIAGPVQNVAPGLPIGSNVPGASHGSPSMFGCDSAPTQACPPAQCCAPQTQCCPAPAGCGHGKQMGGLFGGWFSGSHGHASPLDGGCLPDVCPPGNTWYVNTEYLLWSLRGDQTPPLVTTGSRGDPIPGALGQPNTRVLYGGEGLGTESLSGSRLTIGHWFSQAHYWGFELSGFFLGRQNDQFTASSLDGTVLARPFVDRTPNPIPVVINGVTTTVPNPTAGQEVVEIVAGGPTAGSVNVSRSAILWGAEANLRRGILCCENGFVDLLFGFRTMGLDENLQITETVLRPPLMGVRPGAELFTVTDRFETTNRFYGGQIGFDSEYRICRWSLGLKTKVGIGNTQQTVNLSGATTSQFPSGQLPTMSGPGGLLVLNGTNLGRYSRNEFSIIPELGLTVGYQVTPWLRATVGYNFLYWSNVLRPGGTIDRGVNTTFLFQRNDATVRAIPSGESRPAPVFNTSDFWSQGLTLGLEVKW